jgi:hypothetical protein
VEADARECCDKRFRSDNAGHNALPPPVCGLIDMTASAVMGDPLGGTV